VPCRLPLIAASLAALLLTPATAAAADTLALEAPAVAVEETAVRIVARGEASPDRRLFVFTEPRASACAPTPAEQKLRPAATEHTYRYVTPPSYMDVVTPSFEDAGAQLVCAYLAVAPDELPVAIASRRITVRRPGVALSVKHRNRTLRLAGRSEIPRGAFVYVASRGKPCAPTAERMASRRGSRELLSRSVSDEFRQTLFLPPAGPRRLIACAYVSEAQDAAPDARRSLRLLRR